MKKVLLIEVCVLAVLLVVAIVVAVTLSRPTFSPDSIQNTTEPATQPAESTLSTEPTEFVPTWNTYPVSRQLLAQQSFV